MFGITIRLGMRHLLWLLWLYEVFTVISGFPVTSSNFTDNHWSPWEPRIRYIIGSIVSLAMVFGIFGCLCCRRERRAKGFQEFKDGSQAGSETVIERGLELQLSRSNLQNVAFEPLTVERFVPETKASPKPPSPSLYSNHKNDDSDDSSPARAWFTPGLHVPRERLKYLRELGRGWFGKVVEGTQDLEPGQTRGVVVRILTEEASNAERAWFLGEALPYLKLHHRNLLELFGACLEADPYLLLFESCPTGDLKTFLRSNRESTALLSENLPLRMAQDILAALDHMHHHGFAHTDLSARNCLVAADLTAKLGDYGIGVEKYPGDYYVVGDRALPIRWSAPESLVCSDTTIETRAITPAANIWSFGVVLWEIATWGERPYDNLSDERVIEMIYEVKFHENLPLDTLSVHSQVFARAIEACRHLIAQERASIDEIMMILSDDKVPNFDERWHSLSTNAKEHVAKDDCDFWQPQFKLGPGESTRSSLIDTTETLQQNSGSETEEESWRGRVERGAYTEKVKQKSKSVADLMVLVHIDLESDAEWSLGPAITEKPTKKRLGTSGSVGDLRDTVLEHEFDEALQKLRNLTSKVSKEPEQVVVDNDNYPNDCTSTPKSESTQTFVDVELWKNALEFELQRKIPGFDLEMDFERVSSSVELPNSTPDTPASRAGDLSGTEEEERKHLSTPDDERSSDSGFRDKESCEEEENPRDFTYGHLNAEEEQLKILAELDTILDAEDCGSLDDSTPLTPSKINIDIENHVIINEKPETDVNCIFKDAEESEKTIEHEESTVIEVRDTENDNDDEDSSTMSLRSDNSYVSFNLDEEFVTAIRNELREKLPQAQLAIVESQEPRDEEPSINDAKSWEEDDRSSGAVDITIRYNVFGTPLSPILEERESAMNSESLGDASIASKLSENYDDLLVVDTRTNKVMLVDGMEREREDEDYTDEESMDGCNGLLSRLGQIHGRSGVPLPSPEEESKWQAQFPIPTQLQDDLMSTSFSTEHDWDSADEEDEGGGEEGAQDDEDNSSSSGEFVWKRYNDVEIEKQEYETTNIEDKIDEEGEDEEEVEEFTPSAWDATLEPHRSALRSPEKTLKGDQKKNVWFKKQRYHCVYEYPKETPVPESSEQASTTWEPTTYADWEEMMESPKIDVYPLDYDVNTQNDGEFFVSSGNRPFHFQVGDGRYVSQFFPGATGSAASVDTTDAVNQSEEAESTKLISNNQQQIQLGELRHTRDRLKLNLPMKMPNNSDSTMKINQNELIKVVDDDNDDVNDESEDSRTMSKDISIISVVRSVDESLDLSNDCKSTSTNGDSDAEISELPTTVKSLRRPLTIPSVEKSPAPSNSSELHENSSIIIEATPKSTLMNDNIEAQTSTVDLNEVKPSKVDCEIVETSETDVESTKSVQEST